MDNYSGLLSPGESDNSGLLGYLKKINPSLDVSALYERGLLSGGGRAGLDFPIGKSNASIGVSGGGAIGKGIKEFTVNRLDAGISHGNWNAGVDFDPNDARHNFMLRMGYNF